MRNIMGENNPRWKGGRSVNTDGYVIVRPAGFRRNEKQPYRLEHRILAERALGRPLPPKALVHHGKGNDARHINTHLVICEDHSYHMLLHRRMRAVAATGNVLSLKCNHCKRWDLEGVNGMLVRPNRAGFYHHACNLRVSREYKQRCKQGLTS